MRDSKLSYGSEPGLDQQRLRGRLYHLPILRWLEKWAEMKSILFTRFFSDFGRFMKTQGSRLHSWHVVKNGRPLCFPQKGELLRLLASLGKTWGRWGKLGDVVVWIDLLAGLLHNFRYSKVCPPLSLVNLGTKRGHRWIYNFLFNFFPKKSKS